MSDPALVIPLRIDGADALAKLRAVSDAGKKAGGDVAKGGEQASRGRPGTRSRGLRPRLPRAPSSAHFSTGTPLALNLRSTRVHYRATI